MMTRIRRSGLVALGLIALGVAQAQIVNIDSGKLKGAEADGVVSFKGIPYAAPPVGELRWRDDQPVAPWSGVREATSFGADCEQAKGADGPVARRSEDCLFVNVWRPANAQGPLPVMVWVHGGGFVAGGVATHGVDGTQYAKQGIVLVTLTYRLGRFGFFSFPALTAETPNEVHGNYGLLDQITALKWVQKNIAAFGGDPKNVTIFGESAGGFSMQTMLTSPLAKGLFAKAIVESGGGRVMKSRLLSTANVTVAEATGVGFAKSVGIDGTGKEALAKLRALPPETVRGDLTMQKAKVETDTYSGPIVDGKLAVQTPEQVYREHKNAHVPLMIGATNQDAGFPDELTADALYATFGSHVVQAKAAYEGGAGPLDFGTLRKQVSSDRVMVEPARFVASTLAAEGMPSYEYRFSYVPVEKRATEAGAPHASDVIFEFDNVSGPVRKAAPSDEATAKAMLVYWSNFAKTGDPNGGGLPVWPKYSPAIDMLMDFTNDGPKAEKDPWKARLDVTQAAAEDDAKK